MIDDHRNLGVSRALRKIVLSLLTLADVSPSHKVSVNL